MYSFGKLVWDLLANRLLLPIRISKGGMTMVVTGSVIFVVGEYGEGGR